MLCGLLTPDEGSGTCLGHDIVARGVGDQAPGRLHDPALQPLRGSQHPGEPRLRRTALRHGPAPRAGGRGARAAGPRQPQGPARRRPLGRLEAAPGAGRGRPARAQAPPARRAHRRRRSQGPARVLGRDPPLRRRRHDRPGQHPLHGRGRALPSHRLHLLRPAAHRGHHPGGARRSPGLATWQAEGHGVAAAGAGAARAAGSRDGRTVRLDAPCQRHRSRRAGGRHRALARRSRPRLAGDPALARGRVHPPDGHVRDNFA